MYSPITGSVSAVCRGAKLFPYSRLLLMMLASALMLAVAGASVRAQSCSSGNAREFLRKIVGDWIGTCEQTTDGEKADDKYFHVAIKEIDPNTFQSKFEYYRLDPKTAKPISAGTSTVITTVEPDGTAKSAVNGKGTVLVFQKPKTQEHTLTEVISASETGIKGQGSGSIKVTGMPLGLGKNGKVVNAKSAWSLDDGVFCVHQTLEVDFKALFVKKSFDVVAHYTARRGSDVATLITDKSRLSSSASRAAFQ